MNRKICMALLCLLISSFAHAQQFKWTATAEDSTSVDRQVKQLASELAKTYRDANQKTHLENLYRLQLLTGENSKAITTLKLLLPIWQAESPYRPAISLSTRLYASAKAEQLVHPADFKGIYKKLFRKAMEKLDDKSAYREYTGFVSSSGLNSLREQFKQRLSFARDAQKLSTAEALALCTSYIDLRLFEQTEAMAQQLILEDCKRRYAVTEELVRLPNGIRIHVIRIIKKGESRPLPAAMQFTIYAEREPNVKYFAAAAYGYAGIMAYSRGKGLSPDEIVPYEHDGEDADQVISWVAKQKWCNGKVGMYGGSYNGFTQWAAAKYRNPALKTIVPYVAAIPGLGLPMENNVFLNANYGWAFYTTNNRYLDNKVYNDPARWRNLNWNWFNSKSAYHKIDSIDGTPNPWLQKWLKHPDYDSYWQQQIPYQKDYAGINIPVLTVEGYYDDGQISGLHYYLEHLKNNPKADHYLLIGPYDHFGTQSGGIPVLRDYKLDPVALISTREITFQWLDYVLKGAKKPGIIKDKVNYEVMGANKWQHDAAIEKIATKRLRMYLSTEKQGHEFLLSLKQPLKKEVLADTIDLADRQKLHGDYYPSPIIKAELNRSNGFFFVSEPFDHPVQINGRFSGELKAIINKQDFDVTVAFYEVTPEGKYFQLSYFMGRASYAKDMTHRQLLEPGREESIPFERTRMVSRQLSKGSRLLVVLNTDKNPFAQINYGTGKDVAEETAEDGKVPLIIQWLSSSYVEVGIR